VHACAKALNALCFIDKICCSLCHNPLYSAVAVSYAVCLLGMKRHSNSAQYNSAAAAAKL
jgi:hypothetical protein